MLCSVFSVKGVSIKIRKHIQKHTNKCTHKSQTIVGFLFIYLFAGDASAESEHQTAGPEVIYDDVPCEDLSSGEGQSCVCVCLSAYIDLSVPVL